MGGTWNPSPPPIRPGFYINFETAGTDSVAAGNSGVVGLPITADWGPVEEFVLLSSDALYQNTYGGNNKHTSYLVQEAFRGGASQVLAYRVTDGTEEAAAVSISDEGSAAEISVTQETAAAAGTNEVVKVDLDGASGGDYTLSFDDGGGAQVTAAISWDATADDIKTALEALSNIEVGDVEVAVDPSPGLDVYYVTFTGNLRGLDISPGLVLDTDSTTGGGGVTVSEDTAGAAGTNQVQKLELSAGVTGGTFTLTFNDGVNPAETTAAIAYNANAASVASALEALTVVGAGNVSVTGGSLPGTAVEIEFQGALREVDYALLVVDADNLALDSNVVINLTAKYPGTRGNNLRVTIEDNPLASISNPKTDVKIWEGNDLREKYTVADLDHASLVDKINDSNNGSDLVIAELDSGHPDHPGPYTARLARTAPSLSLSGGLDGVTDPMPVGVWTDALDAFERQGGFDVFCLPDVHDSDYLSPGITATVVDWVKTLNDRGQYVLGVVGGALGEDVDEAIARSEGADSEWIVNIGRSDLTVTYPLKPGLAYPANITVPGQDNEGRVIRRTAALTSRVAGLIGSVGVLRAITFLDVSSADSSVELRSPMTIDEVETAITSGVLCFTRRGPRVVVEDGVTSFTTYTEERDRTFGNIKCVRTMQKIGRDFTELIENGFIGATNNNAATRSSLINIVKGYLAELEGQGVIVPGSEVILDDRYENSGENIHLLLLVQFSRELKRVLMTLRAPLLS